MSKVIVKMSFKHPNFKTTSSKNVAHVNYIATRPGVDKSLSEEDLSKELGKDQSDNKSYLKYIDERPNSHGLFGNKGIENLNEVKEEINSSKSFVWRAIVSLREEDAKELEYMKKDRWQELIKRQMPDVAKNMGIKLNNLRWVAAVHMEKGHPHTHIMFWEKEKEKTVGKISNVTLNKIRKGFTDTVYEAERMKLIQEKNTMRDLTRDLAKEKLTNISKELKDQELYIKSIAKETNISGVMPKIYSDQEAELLGKIDKLSKILPNKGRVAFQFMPDEVKKEILEITDYILKQDVMSGAVARNLKATEELTRMYTGKQFEIEQAKNNAYEDIRKRVSQIVLKSAVESKSVDYYKIDNNLCKSASYAIMGSEKILEKEVVDKTLGNMSKVLMLSGQSKEQAIMLIDNWCELSGNEINKEDIIKIVEKVSKSITENEAWGKTTVINKEQWQDMFKELGVKEEAYMYKSRNDMQYNVSISTINNIWKGAFGTLQQQEMQTQAQSQMLKKQNEKQQIQGNKAAQKEQIQKNKASSLYREDELER